MCKIVYIQIEILQNVDITGLLQTFPPCYYMFDTVIPLLQESSIMHWKSGLIKGVASLEGG